jgi:hypothetical protein
MQRHYTLLEELAFGVAGIAFAFGLTHLIGRLLDRRAGQIFVPGQEPPQPQPDQAEPSSGQES